MIKVALTGNIGSGKSTVAQIFNIFGINVFNADNEARSLYNEQNIIDILTESFTNVILTSDGVIDKKKLASLIFNDEKALKKVVGIIHPLVLQKYARWCLKYSDESYTIHESAILFENNLQGNFDKVINVSASEDTRIARVMKRDNIREVDVRERMYNQLDDKVKCKLSDFVIENNETEFLIPQVFAIHNKLISAR